MGIMGYNEQDIRTFYQKCYVETFDSWWKNSITWTLPATEIFLRQVITPEVLETKINGKLFIGTTKLTSSGIQSDITNQFENVDHFINTAMASMNIMPLSQTPFRRIRSQGKIEYHMDGSMTKKIINLPGYDKIVEININNFEGDISPINLLPKTTMEEYDNLVNQIDKLKVVVRNQPVESRSGKIVLLLHVSSLLFFIGTISSFVGLCLK